MERDDMRELNSHMQAIRNLLERGSGGGQSYERERRMGERYDPHQDTDRRAPPGGWQRPGDHSFNQPGGLGDEERRIIDTIIQGVTEKVVHRIMSEMERRFPVLTQMPAGYSPTDNKMTREQMMSPGRGADGYSS
jgi:hypothetical protein